MIRSRRFAIVAAFFAAFPLHATDAVTDGLSACARIASSSGRLACFDRLASGAGAPPVARSGAAPVSSNLLAVASNERGRSEDDMRFRMTQPPGTVVKGGRVLITAPATNTERPKPLMVIACIDRITRLQLVVHPPVAVAQAQVSLFLDDQPLAADQAWQVLEGGHVLDAGRGLAAIDLLRRIRGGDELRVESGLAAIDGLHFDATGLSALIASQRKACRW